MARVDINPGQKPILAVLNRKNHEGELGSLVAANKRARVPRSIMVASTVRDDKRTWNKKTAEIEQYAAVWAGGSGDIDVTHNTPLQTQFLNRLNGLIEQADKHGVPFYGECLTYQGINLLMGAQVVRDPARWEGGTIPLHFTSEGEQHPYLAGLPNPTSILSLHKDSVPELIPDPRTQVLAWSEGNPKVPGVGNPYAIVTFGPFFIMQPHALYKPKDISVVFQTTNDRIRAEGILEPFPQTHPFDAIDDCERVVVNFIDALPVEGDIFTPVPIASPSSNR